MKTKVDLIVSNAKIYTVNKKFEMAESFAVQNGIFVAIGSNETILKKYSATNKIDVKGKTIFPGFIDSHCHFYGLGLTMQHVNLVATKSYEEVLNRIVDFQIKKPSKFIQGRGWNQNDWKIKEFPTKEKLDRLFPNIPVAVNRIDGHAMLVNQKTLDMANIDISTKVSGGEILIKDGKLTGILLDNAMNLVYKIIPKPNKETQIKALQEAENQCFSYGLTSVSDAELGRKTIELMDELHVKDELKIRIYTMILATENSLKYYLKKGISKTKRLTINAFKFYIDGALGSKGAFLKENYLHSNQRGILVNSEKKLLEIAKKIKDSDFQLNVHAIGDKANEIVLKTFVEKIKIPKNRRWRIEHAQIIAKEDFKYFETVFPSVQPTHATSDMYWAEKLLGKQRMKGAYAYKDLLQKHGKIALGTDFPIEQINPFFTFYSTVARKDINGFPKDGFQIENALTREETLKGMTIWGAYANFEENEKGSIEIGKFADFIVLDKDIMNVEIDAVPSAKVLKTFVGGELVYEKNKI